MPSELADRTKAKTDATGYHMAKNPIETIRNRYKGVHEGGAQQNDSRDGNHHVGSAQDAPSQDMTHGGSAPQHSSDPDRSRAEAVTSEFLGRSTSARTVRDPVTHGLLENVRDVTEEEYEGGLEEAEEIGSYVPRSGERRKDHAAEEKRQELGGNQGIYQGKRSGTSAIPAFPFHDPLRPRYQAALDSSAPRIRKALLVVLGVWTAILAALLPNLKSIALFVVSALLFGALLPQLVQNRLQDALEDCDAEGEEQRGEKIAASHWPESAEWANKILGEIWPALEPEFFDSLKDTLEDMLQANLPSFLTECKVADFTQGANPLRILSATLLPDTEWENDQGQSNSSGSTEKEKEEGGSGKDELSSEIGAAREQHAKETDPEAAMLREQHDPNDRYVNLSVSFAYRGRQKKERQEFGMAEDVQMLLYLMAKLGPVAAMLPVKVHLKGLVGTVRLRIHLISSPPFLGQTLISFTSLPRLTINVLPLKLVSLNDFKPLADFIQTSIDSSLAALTAPKSMTLDLADLIASDGVQRKILALGVVVVTIHSIKGLERADLMGSSDAYAIVTWSRSGKPMYSTRVLVDELNPRFNESAALLVPQEVVKAEERVGIELYDSDVGQDDFLGFVGIELSELLSRPGEEVKRHEQLGGVRPGTQRGGMVEWSARFLPKVALQKEPTARKDPGEKRDDAQAGDADDESKDQQQKQEKDSKRPAVEYITPSQAHPSGILSVQIHEVSALSNKSTVAPKGSTLKMSKRTPLSGRSIPDEDTMDDQAFDEAPSSYVEVILEGKLVYRTRTKVSDYRPIFNACTEKVILNVFTARMLLVVREKKLDEDDPILGVVPIKLSEVFDGKSLSAGWYPIAGGGGSGRIKVSMLFRSVDGGEAQQQQQQQQQGEVQEQGRSVSVPRGGPGVPVSPLEIGVVHIKNIQIGIRDGRVSHYAGCPLVIKTLSSRAKLHSKHGETEGEGTLSYTQRLASNPVRIPVFKRGSSPLLIRLDGKDKLGRKRTRALGVCWLRDVVDGRAQELELPLWDGEEERKVVSWLSQQYLPFENQEALLKEHCTWPTTRLGTIRIKLALVTGVSTLHSKITDTGGSLPQVCQAWRLAVSKGLVVEGEGEAEEGSGNRGAGRRDELDGGDGDGVGGGDDSDSSPSSSSDDGGEGEDGVDGAGHPGNGDARLHRSSSRSSSSSSSLRQKLRRVPSDPEKAPAHSSGSPLDLVRRAQRHVSQSRHPLSNLTSTNAGGANLAGEDDPKVVRVMDSALGQLRGRGEKLMNKFDVKKSQKGGEGVEMEV
ncbi:hypothetical protein BCV69DRAFT_314760 [Microstroma glucosiphilum]|uniref:C2 domain-containing protein n=1 Tax=Pseudomicrostroma glucosiphilum TaxID=1684307 RepID=A0A316TYA1_9BASI|nr:hypothetical protein BCV69DRAFT_314760 [Pseudomicrostroma glucosiphilum]PWN18222.1 hypothetical protein BCV69DRAFT_314760 [Pseudomicrostroma glucosiphilum]